MSKRRVLFVEFNQDPFLRGVAEVCSGSLDPVHASKKLLDSSQEYWNLIETPRQAWHDRQAAFVPQSPDTRIMSARDMSLTLDRIFPNGMSQNDRELYLLRLAELVKQKLDDLRPDCAIFQFVPHMPFHIMIERVLTSRGIPVLALCATQLVDRIKVVRLPNSVDEKNFLPSPFPPAMTNDSTERLNTPRLELAQMINRDSERSDRTLLLSGIRDFCRRALEEAKGNARPYNQFSTIQTLQVRKINEFRGISSALSLRRHHDRASSNLPQGKFVVLFLQYTPEQNSDPDSGPFRYPEHAVRTVRELIDHSDHSKTALVVREHPRQLLPKPIQNNLAARRSDLYTRLANLNNVVVCDRRISSDYLLRTASLVVTAAGSSAWLAGAHGTPGLALAGIWHEQCESSPSLAQLVRSGKTIDDLLRLSKHDVIRARQHFLQNDAELWPGVCKSSHLSGDRSQVSRAMAGWLEDLLRVETS